MSELKPGPPKGMRWALEGDAVEHGDRFQRINGEVVNLGPLRVDMRYLRGFPHRLPSGEWCGWLKRPGGSR